MNTKPVVLPALLLSAVLCMAAGIGIKQVTGLQAALDAKLATSGL